jgi:cysteine desulfurase
MEPIYLDNNATTPLLPEVVEAMHPFWSTTYGNPASTHTAGRRARRALEDARERIATLLGADADEVVFTSGATEANNLALFGLLGAAPGHIIASPVEHPCVAEPLRRLTRAGHTVTYLPVSGEGVVAVEALTELLCPATQLVSVMLANHETGALQPVQALAAQLDNRAAFHCDAVQAVGKIPVHFHNLGVTSLSLSGHKTHGPKGIGALLVRRRARLQPQLWGGHQQQERRPGTEPVALVVGLATALELWHRDAERRTTHISQLRMRFLEGLHAQAAPVVLNGPPSSGIAHTVNISFPGCTADALLMNLDLAGVACSTGSACSSGSLLPSPVLQAMGIGAERLHSAMRFSLSPLLSEAEMDEAVGRIAAVVKRLRGLAPD